MARFRQVLAALGAAVLFSVGHVGAASAQACPSYNNPTVFGSATLNAGFQPDPYVRNLTAGARSPCRPAPTGNGAAMW
jgi:hypothetical protein